MSTQTASFNLPTERQDLCRAITSDHPLVLTEIFKPEHNLAIWQRRLPDSLTQGIEQALQQGLRVKIALQVTPQNVWQELRSELAQWPCGDELSANISELAEMYSILFEARTLGIRLTTLDSAMCPRFHVDRVGCRLVSAFYGPGSEWLADEDVDRRHLGPRDSKIDDISAGLYITREQIQPIGCGDVALLKGSNWEGNQHNAIVHRSPPVPSGQTRLLLSIDLID